MKSSVLNLPFYAKFTLILLSLYLLAYALYVGNQIIMPFLLSAIFAFLLRPLVVLLNKKMRISHVLAILIAVIFFIFCIGVIIYFILWQISDFISDWPKMQQNIDIHLKNFHQWIAEHFNVSYQEQSVYFQKAIPNLLTNNSEFVGNTITSFSSTILNIILIPVYMFLILLYRDLFKEFLLKLITPENHLTLVEIIMQVKGMVQSYIAGLMIELSIVATLTTIGLMIAGVPYAILLGLITAVLNLIPYIGILAAGLIAIIASLINSTDFSVVIGVVIVNSVVQFLDNNILVPKIVASKVKVNALTSIIGVIIAGTLTGVAGMFLAIPTIAIIKIIFDHVDGLKPWGLLMGEMDRK